MAGIINNAMSDQEEDDPLDTGYVNPAYSGPNASGYSPERITLDEKDSVESRVAGIVSKDSPLNTLARTGAAQTANRRGLINSSMAAGAGEKAVIETALPIASQDAQTSLAAKTSNQNAQNQMLAQQLEGKQRIDQIGKQGGVSSQLGREGFSYDQNIQQLRGNQAKELSEIETRANQIANASNSVGIMSSQVNAAIGEILANPEFNPETKQQLIDMQIKQYRSMLGVLGGMNELDLTGLLDFSAAGGTGSPPKTNTNQQGAGNQGQAQSKDQRIRDWFAQNPNATDAQIYSAMQEGGATPEEVIRVMGMNEGEAMKAYAKQTFNSFAASALSSNTGDQGINSALNKARELGLDARSVYEGMSSFFPGVSFSEFMAEVDRRGYQDLMRGAL